MRVLVFLLGAIVLLSACSERSSTKTFTLKGVVQEVEEDGHRLIIDHDEIPGYMPRMIMPFSVRGDSTTLKLKPGEEIVFEYKVEEHASWIEGLSRTGREGEVKVFTGIKPLPKLLPIGAQMADYSFLDQDGQKVRLSSYAGDMLAITFVFTRCPVPEYCPRMMRNFDAVAQRLQNGGAENWRLLTVSFDPDYDTPEVMKAYGDRFGQSNSQWQLLTTDGGDTIESIAGDVGLKYGEVDGTYLHNLRTVVLDEERRIQKVFTDENWDPEELFNLLNP